MRSVTVRASRMVGMAAMAPGKIDLADRIEDPETRARGGGAGPRALRRARQPGHAPLRLGLMDAQPLPDVLGDPAKRALVAELIGQSFVVAYNTIRANRDGTERVADRLVERRRALRRRGRRTCSTPSHLRKPDDRPARGGHVAGDLIPPPSPAGRPERDDRPSAHRSRSPTLLRTDAEHEAAVEAATPVEPAGRRATGRASASSSARSSASASPRW